MCHLVLHTSGQGFESLCAHQVRGVATCQHGERVRRGHSNADAKRTVDVVQVANDARYRLRSLVRSAYLSGVLTKWVVASSTHHNHSLAALATQETDVDDLS